MERRNLRVGLFGAGALSGLLVWLMMTASLQAADKVVNLRLGTLAPRGTSFHKSLMQMGDKWRQTSGGAVKLTIFPDGSQGGEADMVGLMQTGNLDAGLLTAMGLSEIEPNVNALQNMPMAFRSLEEVDYVGLHLRPQLEKRLLDKGYLILFWSDSGWVRFFTKTPILHPDDLRKLKLFSWGNNIEQFDLWKASGFHPVAMEATSIAQGLMSDSINAIAMPPFFALAGQLNQQTKYMLELNWAPLVGAGVVRKKSWDRVPAELQAKLMAIAAETGKDVKASARAEGASSVEAMVKRGLVVQKVSPEVDVEWRTVAGTVEDRIRGKIVPAEVYDEAQRLLKEFRVQAGEKAP
jgi:TRAP-type transport system periplasmic protein